MGYAAHHAVIFSILCASSACAARAVSPSPAPVPAQRGPAPESEPTASGTEATTTIAPESFEPEWDDADPFRLALLASAGRLDGLVLRGKQASGGYGAMGSFHDPCQDGAGDERCAQAAKLVRAAETRGAASFYALSFAADGAQVWQGARGIRQFLATIDNAAEARMLLYADQGIEPWCGLSLAACERKVDDGFELRSVVQAPRCGAVKETIYLHRVSSAGEIQLSQKTDIPRTGRCTVP